MAPTHPQTRKPTGHENLWYTWCPTTRDPRLATLNQRVLKNSCFSERETKAQGQKPSVWERPPYSPSTPTRDSNNKKLKSFYSPNADRPPLGGPRASAHFRKQTFWEKPPPGVPTPTLRAQECSSWAPRVGGGGAHHRACARLLASGLNWGAWGRALQCAVPPPAAPHQLPTGVCGAF